MKPNSNILPEPTEQEIRTIQLGPADGRSGVAEYRILLAAGKAQRVKPAGERSIEGAEDLIKQVEFSKYFPPESGAKLVKGAFLNCYNGKCLLVLEP